MKAVPYTFIPMECTKSKKTDGSMWRFHEFTDYLQQVRTETGSVLDSLYEHVKELGNSDTLEDDFTILEVAFT